MSEGLWTGRVVLVTGAARGVGRGTAEYLGRLGASVALLDRRADEVSAVAEELRAQGVRCESFGADQTDDEAVEQAIAGVIGAFGRIDGLFANAGLAVMRPFMEISLKEWRKVIDVNLTGTFLVVRQVVQTMIDLGIPGSIVMTGSVSGMHPMNQTAHYASAKAGVIAFGRELSRELGSYRIRVNLVSPGVVRTEATEFLITQPAISTMLQQVIPLGSWCMPKDIAQAVAFLLGPQSAYITGAVLPVAGGNEVIEWWPIDYSTPGPPDWEKLRPGSSTSGETL
ncbi:MAG: SDR family oxidoreductase [Thermoleophilia bacterium]|nr:SDR family oxidoreductase [Thermoleophilia bacterium]